MSDNCPKCGSHAGFYMCMALLAVAISGAGYWWFTANNLDADKEATAQMNQPSHPPKNVKSKTADASSAAQTTGASTADGK